MFRTKQITINQYLKYLPLMLHVFFIALIFLGTPLVADGHPGNTDESGCHYDQNGTYHCHR